MPLNPNPDGEATVSPLQVKRLIEWQDEAVRAWHREPPEPEARPVPGAGPPALGKAIREEHVVNIRLWHEEDEARRPDVDDAVIAAVKRRIDALNQARNDLVERIDEELLALHAGRGDRAPDAPLHSETPGAIVDRLSILALKIYHMREEAERADASDEHRERCRAKLSVLETQRSDLAGCLADLLEEVAAGRRRFRIYRQFKMYNDPQTNPAWREAKRDEE